MPVQAPRFHRGELAPSFDLPDATGKRVSWSAFRGRKNVVLLFFGPGDCVEELIRGLDGMRERLQWLDAEVVAIMPVPSVELGAVEHFLLPFTVLSDPSLRVTASYTALDGGRPHPTVVVLDRHGAICRRWMAPDLPSAEDVVKAVELQEFACPECGDPSWPEEEWPI